MAKAKKAAAKKAGKVKAFKPKGEVRPPSADQGVLPDMEQARHAKLDGLCVSIGDAREKANLAVADESAAKQAALDYMAAKDVTVYKHAGIELVRVPGHEKLRVRLVENGGDAQVG